MKDIKDWNGEEIFIQMDKVMTNLFPSIHDLIWEVIENRSKPSQETVGKALALDLFGFIPKGN